MSGKGVHALTAPLEENTAIGALDHDVHGSVAQPLAMHHWAQRAANDAIVLIADGEMISVEQWLGGIHPSTLAQPLALCNGKGVTEATLTALLGRLLGERVELTLGGTDRTPLRAERRPGGTLELALHPCFLLATEETLRDLAQHLRRPGSDTRERLLRFVRAAREEIPTGARRRRPRLSPIGRHHNLAEICAAINREHFAGRLRTGITWGRAAEPRRARRRSIVFGSYDVTTDTVRIHPALDSPRVPRYFVEYIVHHELLHAVHPVRILPGGRRAVHTAPFRRAERSIPNLDRALAFLDRWRGAGGQPRTD